MLRAAYQYFLRLSSLFSNIFSQWANIVSPKTSSLCGGSQWTAYFLSSCLFFKQLSIVTFFSDCLFFKQLPIF